jgi:hypothetical protein
MIAPQGEMPMTTTARFLIAILIALSGRLLPAQITVSNEEPAIVNVDGLFQRADSVAVVNILSGDTEAYDVTVYKAKVIRSFKGVQDGAIIYFGPFSGEKLGGESVVFLLDGKKTLKPKSGAGNSYGAVHYLEVFNQGYSSMESSYECVFDGKEPAQSCDYGVRVCTDYIKLPKTLQTFSPETGPAFGCRWVRKSVFTSLLDTL